MVRGAVTTVLIVLVVWFALCAVAAFVWICAKAIDADQRGKDP